MEIIKKTQIEIKNLKIQGASNIAKASLLTLKEYLKNKEFKDAGKILKKIKEASRKLALARPNEPLTKNIFTLLFIDLKKEKDPKKIKDDFLVRIEKAIKMIERAEEKIAKRIAKIIKDNDKVFTHCHSSTVEKGLILAKKEGKNFEVFVTETRPLFQGRITAKNLIKAGIKTTMVVDSSAGFLISKYSGEELMMTKVIIGCDALLKDGSIINKIGSFGIALSAYYQKVPLYVAGTLLKFTPSSWIKIEKRSPKEVWKEAPKKLKIINFAFDIVPNQFIKKIICEKGEINPKDVQKIIKKTYPWLMKNSPIWP